jgi:predicted membrane metal-binding protein
VIAVQLLATIVAVVLHLLPGVVQQNQPWLLFALPIWLMLAWRLRRPG